MLRPMSLLTFVRPSEPRTFHANSSLDAMPSLQFSALGGCEDHLDVFPIWYVRGQANTSNVAGAQRVPLADRT
jgi:hypothetical protein